jgi:hypothetical protein
MRAMDALAAETATTDMEIVLAVHGRAKGYTLRHQNVGLMP